MRSLLSLSLLPLIASASPLVLPATIHNDAAPILSSSEAREIPDSYIVVFKKHVSSAAASDHHAWVQNLHLNTQATRNELRKRSQFPFASDVFRGLRHTFDIGESLVGYSGHFDADVIESVRRHPDVEYIEKDSEVRTQASDTDYETQRSAPWGLARISHREQLSFSTFSKYLYSLDAGKGVDAYVIDTGINTDHVDFEGRAFWGTTTPNNDEDVDGNGHGTHCSGTIAGKKYGVAKKANVYAVKVLGSNGSGTMSDVVKGVEWAALSHKKNVQDAKKGKKKGFKGSVANMSLGGGKTVTLDRAVNAAVNMGLHFAVAAGNDNSDSCNYSPAAASEAVTVGASTLADERAYFSNWGSCNDIFAPGLNIQSTWIGSKYAVNTISGTSMASPHICGLLAYFLSLQPSADSGYALPDITPKKLKKNLIAIGTKNVFDDLPKNTENVLAWNGGGASNYSDIINTGGYDVSKPSSTSITKEVVSEADQVLEKIEELLSDELKAFEELRKSLTL